MVYPVFLVRVSLLFPYVYWGHVELLPVYESTFVGDFCSGRLMGSGGNGVQLERPHLQTGLFGGVSHRDNRKTGNTDKDCLSCGRALDQLKVSLHSTSGNSSS